MTSTPSTRERTQREIKFRVWDHVEKEMLFPETITPSIAEIQGIVLMQFTGLKDRNGKEIYEGDILKFFDKPVAIVVFEQFGGWSFNWIDKTYKQIRQNPEPFFRNINLFEVVGNIYEHPHLLAPENNNSPDLVENTSGIQTTFFVVKKPEGFEEHPVEFPPGYEYTVRAGAAFDDHKGEIELITPTEKDRDYQKQKQWKDF